MLDGLLLNDGSKDDRGKWLAAPYKPEAIRDYAVEVEAELLRWGCDASFGVIVRNGYRAGLLRDWRCNDVGARIAAIDSREFYERPLVNNDYKLASGWHRYRLEVKSNNIRLFIDGELILETKDNRHISGGLVGLWSYNAQITVRSFTVSAL